jgi:uncharacterized protein YpbB
MPLKNSYAETKGQKGLKGYNDVLKSLLEDLEEYLNGLKEATLLEKSLYTKKANDQLNVKIEKKPSHLISFQMFEEGLNPDQIAAKREITKSTVLSHLAKMASVGILNIERLFSEKDIQTFLKIYHEQNFETLTQWKTVLPDSFGFDEIRILLNHFNYQKTGKIEI